MELRKPADLFDSRNPGRLAREVRRLREVARTRGDRERAAVRISARWQLEAMKLHEEVQRLKAEAFQ